MAFNKELAREIGKRLRFARQKSGYNTIVSFSSKYNLARSTYNQYEIGDRLLCIDTAIIFAKILNTNLLWLLTGEGKIDITDNQISNLIAEESKIENSLSQSEFMTLLENGKQLPQKPSSKNLTNKIDIVILEQIITKVFEMFLSLTENIDYHKIAYVSSYIYEDMMQLNHETTNRLNVLDIITSAFKNLVGNKK